jgi:hypothetical protein
MITFKSSDQRRRGIPSIEQCTKCGAFIMAVVVAGESALPRHECQTQQPRCDVAIKQDNPDGPENERHPMQLLAGAKPTAYTSASATSMRTVGFNPSIWKTLADLRPNLITDDEHEA